MQTLETPDLSKTIASLIGRAPDDLRRMEGQWNNAVFEVHAGNDRFVAKVYFTHGMDPRDRLSAEFDMLSFLWRQGIRCIPHPVCSDAKNRIAVYSFIDGVHLCHETLTENHVTQLVDFLYSMWNLRIASDADALPDASDSAFSVHGHFQNVRRRLDRLLSALPGNHTAASEDALDFLRNSLSPFMEELTEAAASICRRRGIDMSAELPKRERTLSPADHGFHNALEMGDGRLCFLDFEYSGWDDPAQMISNACHQPSIPLGQPLAGTFVSELLKKIDPEGTVEPRFGIIDPLLGLKWCLIMLNEFLPEGRERRRFAGQSAEEVQPRQLDKARRKFYEVASCLHSRAMP